MVNTGTYEDFAKFSDSFTSIKEEITRDKISIKFDMTRDKISTKFDKTQVFERAIFKKGLTYNVYIPKVSSNINYTKEVKALKISSQWKKEGIESPSKNCRKKTISILNLIEGRFLFGPSRIAPSIEEGIMIHYKDKKTNTSLNIEIYNDLDIAAIVTKNKKIIKVLDIYDDSFEEIIDYFKNN